eukprot:m.80925 g.80925  ORF g.80925 m.80925 type:complete len:73 (-) comp20951_c0_seq2:550-768(-)
MTPFSGWFFGGPTKKPMSAMPAKKIVETIIATAGEAMIVEQEQLKTLQKEKKNKVKTSSHHITHNTQLFDEN